MQITVVFPTYTLGRSEENFEDALTFKPDRWDKGARSHNPFAYIPWGFGPRSCYGEYLHKVVLSDVHENESALLALKTSFSE